MGYQTVAGATANIALGGQYGQGGTSTFTNATIAAAQAVLEVSVAINSYFLGAHATAPTVDNSGGALQVGVSYFNTTDNFTYTWTGSTWITTTAAAADPQTVYWDVNNTFTATQTPVRATATGTASTTYTWTLGSKQVLELTFPAGNLTAIAFSGGVTGTTYLLHLKQDSVGSRTTAWTSFKWAAGTAPTLSTAANAVDIFTFYYDGTSMINTGKSQGVA